MQAEDVCYMSVPELSELIRTRAMTCSEIVHLFLDRVETFNPYYRAYVRLDADAAVRAAAKADSAIARGRYRGMLHGIPFAVKDQFFVRGEPPTCGSRVALGAHPGLHASAIQRLERRGAILLGRLNLSEFGLGDPFEYPFGRPKNPWKTTRIPGGSSSGSGIAVAAGMCTIALGQDTNGSIRNPAALCGVSGIRPTWGLVSRHGLVGMSPSQDVVGPLARSADDCAVTLDAIAGDDWRDPTTLKSRRGHLSILPSGAVTGIRAGVLAERMSDAAPIEPEVRTSVAAAMETLRQSGMIFETVSAPAIEAATAASMVIAMVERSSIHRDLMKRQLHRYDHRTQVGLLAGTLVPAQVFEWANAVRRRVTEQLNTILRQADIIVLPTSPASAPPIERRSPPVVEADVLNQVASQLSPFRTPFALAGLPAMSIPCGFDSSGLPVGLQLVGRRFDEELVLRVAATYQRMTSWHLMRPAITRREATASDTSSN